MNGREHDMNTARVTRFAVTGGAAALCFGVAAPAVACTVGGTGAAPASAQTRQIAAQRATPPTLAQEQAWIDGLVAHRTAWLDRVADLVSGNSNLTADQQSAALAWIARAKAQLAQLQSQVDAATSTAQVHDILAAQARDLVGGWWPGYSHFGHRAGKHAAPAPAPAVRQQPAKAHYTTVRTVSDRSGTAGPAAGRFRWDGRHWDHHDRSVSGRHWQHSDHWQHRGWGGHHDDVSGRHH
jgi:hypothetical protein